MRVTIKETQTEVIDAVATSTVVETEIAGRAAEVLVVLERMGIAEEIDEEDDDDAPITGEIEVLSPEDLVRSSIFFARKGE